MSAYTICAVSPTLRRVILALLGAAVCVLTSAAHAAWNYSESRDDMTGTLVKSARATSRNLLNFGFPYGGPQRAYLYVREHPRSGTNVIVEFARAHFLCSSSGGCNLLVRFDDKPAMEFSAAGPSDLSTNTVFIDDETGFVRELKSAKLVRIESEFYQAGSKILEFSVAGLQWGEVNSKAEKAAAERSRIVETFPQCSKQASSQTLKGEDRKKFISDCMKGGD